MNKTSKEKEAVLAVFASLLRPLMRVAFEYGITAGEISGVMRRTYIQALEARLKDQKRPITDARMAIMAGLPNSDVTALRAALREGAPHSSGQVVSPERISTVLTMWNTEPSFSGAYGVPTDLDLEPTPGSRRRSFKELVDKACPEGVDEGALLDALVAAKSVEVVDGISVRCVSRAYVTGSADVDRIEQIGRFVEAIAHTFAYNLGRAPDQPVFFERAVVSDTLLTESGRDEFLALCSKKGQELLADLDTLVAQLDTSKSSPSGKRYGLGVYFFEDPTSDRPNSRKPETRGLKSGPTEKIPTEPVEIDVLAGLTGQKN
jgi:hypothetical protein